VAVPGPRALAAVRSREIFVADLRHFLDLADDVPVPARRMAERLTMIVRAATAGDAGAEWVSALPCDRRPGRRPCPGHLAVVRTDIPLSIGWHFTSCGDEGVISGWERSPDDPRPQHPRQRSADAQHVVIPGDVAATLRALRLLDSDTERFVFRAQASGDGIVLVGDDDDLDELAGYMAAEANHEDNRRRQRRLDHAFETVTRAVDAPRRS
jgi:hypothetical protein